MVGVVAGVLRGLLHSPVAPHFVVGLLVLVALAAALATPAGFDLAGLSAAALGVITLLITGLALQQ